MIFDIIDVSLYVYIYPFPPSFPVHVHVSCARPAQTKCVELKVHLKRGVRPASWLREWAYLSALEEGLHLAQELPIVQTEGQIFAPLVPRLQVS